MRLIPRAQRSAMEYDRFYKICCLCVKMGGCNGRIEWHHNLIVAGRQSNAYWSILPLCHLHHIKADHHDIKERLNHIMLNRATNEQLIEVSKAIDYVGLRDRLNKKYENI